MRNNLVPALILAAAILAVAFISRRSGADHVKEAMDQLEHSVQAKDAQGNTQVARIASGLSRSTADGIRQGFQGGHEEDVKKELETREKVALREIKIVPGRMKNQEKVIGLLKNGSSETIQNVSLNVIFKDANGGLLDVSSRSSSIHGILKPGDEVGFEVERELGGFREKEDDLAQRKAADVTVSVTGLSIVR